LVIFVKIIKFTLNVDYTEYHVNNIRRLLHTKRTSQRFNKRSFLHILLMNTVLEKLFSNWKLQTCTQCVITPLLSSRA